MAARVEIYEDTAGEFRFRVIAGNGEIVSTSEGYTRKHDAQRAADRLGELLRPHVEVEGLGRVAFEAYDLALRGLTEDGVTALPGWDAWGPEAQAAWDAAAQAVRSAG